MIPSRTPLCTYRVASLKDDTTVVRDYPNVIRPSITLASDEYLRFSDKFADFYSIIIGKYRHVADMPERDAVPRSLLDRSFAI